jgi:hypothetical protein
MNPDLLKAGAYITLALALFGLTRALIHVGKIILDLHLALRIFIAEHEIVSEDYCMRNQIERHNMRTMALARAASRTANGKANGKANGASGV